MNTIERVLLLSVSTIVFALGEECHPYVEVNGVKYEGRVPEGIALLKGGAAAPLADCGKALDVCPGVAGSICLIQRGTNTDKLKVHNCERGGGIAAVLYDVMVSDECDAEVPEYIGNGICNMYLVPDHNTTRCGYDGGDCLLHISYPDCNVDSPWFLGNGICENYDETYEDYITSDCGFDGGDCIDLRNSIPAIRISDTYGEHLTMTETGSSAEIVFCDCSSTKLCPEGNFCDFSDSQGKSGLCQSCPTNQMHLGQEGFFLGSTRSPDVCYEWPYNFTSSASVSCLEQCDLQYCTTEKAKSFTVGKKEYQLLPTSGFGYEQFFYADVSAESHLTDCGKADTSACENAVGKVCLVERMLERPFFEQLYTCYRGGCIAAIFYDNFQELFPSCSDLSSDSQFFDVLAPLEIGDGYCSDEDYRGNHTYPNTKACGYDGGDCKISSLPNCTGDEPHWVGDGFCDDDYNTPECAFDAGDCVYQTLHETYPNCDADNPKFIGDGGCDIDYNTTECGFDGGDCIGERVFFYDTHLLPPIFYISHEDGQYLRSASVESVVKVEVKQSEKCLAKCSERVPCKEGFCNFFTDDDTAFPEKYGYCEDSCPVADGYKSCFLYGLSERGASECEMTCGSSLTFDKCKFCPTDVTGMDLVKNNDEGNHCELCPNDDFQFPDREFGLFGEGTKCWMVDFFFRQYEIDSNDDICRLSQSFNHICGCTGPGYAGADTELKRSLLVWLPRVAAISSALGSSFIIFDVLRNKTKLRKSLYRQMMLTLSIFDLIGSIAYSLTSLPLPSSDFIHGSKGSDATCVAQGFFIQVGTTSSFLSVSLSFYYLLTIKYKYSERKIKKLRVWLLGCPILIGLGMAFAGIPFYDNLILWCNNSSPYYWPEIPVAIGIGVATFVMAMLCFHIVKIERASARWRQGNNSRSSVSSRVLWQAFYYLMAFYVTWTLYLALQLSWSIKQGYTNYAFILIAGTLVPLQGLWNSFVFSRVTIKKELQNFKSSVYNLWSAVSQSARGSLRTSKSSNNLSDRQGFRDE